MTEQSGDTKTGAPRWTYIVGALVAVAGLVWGIVSFLMSRSEPPVAPLPVQHADAEGGTAINASGSAQVSVGAASTSEAAKSAVTDTSSSLPAEQPAQNASAGLGGTAINASGDAEVKLESPTQP